MRQTSQMFDFLSPLTGYPLSFTPLILTINDFNVKPEVGARSGSALSLSHFTKRAPNGRIKVVLLKYSGVSLL